MNAYHIILEELSSRQIPCYFKSLTSIDCPGCGIQTSFLLLMKGDVLASIAIYPALIPILVSAGLLLIKYIKKTERLEKLIQYAVLISAILILANYGYKIYTLQVF